MATELFLTPTLEAPLPVLVGVHVVTWEHGRSGSLFMRDPWIDLAEACGVCDDVDFDDLPAPDCEAGHRIQLSTRDRDHASCTVHKRRLNKLGNLRVGERLLGHRLRPTY